MAMNGALIYPQISLNNKKLIKSYLLLYDNLFRIIPSGIQPDDDQEISELAREYGIISGIYPDEYVDSVGQKFEHGLSKWSRVAAGFGVEIDTVPSLLHQDKVCDNLKKRFIKEGYLNFKGDYLQGDDELINQYMIFLAGEIAEKEGLDLLSDDSASYVYQEFLNYDGNFDINPLYETRPNQILLASMIFDNYIPEDIEFVSNNKLIEFRDGFRKERKRFMEEYDKFSRRISTIKSPSVLKAHLIDHRLSLDNSIEEYKNALSHLNKSLIVDNRVISTITIASQIAGCFISIEPRISAAISVVGLSLGGLWNLECMDDRIENIRQKNPNSYLYLLKEFDLMDAEYMNYYLKKGFDQLIMD